MLRCILKEGIGIPILQTGTAAAKDRFSVVFAMWEGVLYKFWEDGAAVSEQWPYARPDDI